VRFFTDWAIVVFFSEKSTSFFSMKIYAQCVITQSVGRMAYFNQREVVEAVVNMFRFHFNSTSAQGHFDKLEHEIQL
jgi:hypothetical protein